ncbi:uncharacterized protein LOC111254199 [Varroa destructor]|uniref:RING-type domain-containing protein n=1 Tax=Varroa destructor TaxID=109461 RepID=A0A7M7KQP7_VARDE|nr:uncharacterized protein LOC111254199 [Varroa destructor]
MSKACTDGGYRPSLASINPSLTCALCKGYLVNAMTLIRCMHSFCKSCIHRHLDTSSACPTCQQRVFRSRMDLHMVADNTLQSIVYKTVPGLFANEMRRRWDFYEQNEDSPDAIKDKEVRKVTSVALRQIFTEQDCISLVLEHRQEQAGGPKFLNMYLNCRANVPVWVIIKFVRNKFSPPASLAIHLHLEKVNVNKPKLAYLNKGVTKDSKDSNEDKDKDRLLLDPDLTLIDVCYIADYKFEGPLKLSFRFVEFDPSLGSKAKALYEPLAPLEPAKSKSNSNLKQQQPPRQQNVNGKHVFIANGGILSSGSNVQYGKYKVDTKSIDMARGALLNGNVSTTKGGTSSNTSKSKTYSRAGGVATMIAPGQVGQLPQLKSLALGPGVLENCNHETTGDSTEEEEADNWDSNVSTTIDRTLTTSQQQNTSVGNHSSHVNQTSNKQQQLQHQSLINGNATDKNISSLPNLGRHVQCVSSQNSTKHSKALIANSPSLSSGQVQIKSANGVSASTVGQQKKNQAIVSRPQTLKVTSSQVSVDATVPQKSYQMQQTTVGRNQHSNVGSKVTSSSSSSSSSPPSSSSSSSSSSTASSSASSSSSPQSSLSVEKDKTAAGKQILSPAIQQSSPVGHHKTNQGHKNNHKNSPCTSTSSSTGSSTHHHHHGHSHHGGTHKSGHIVPSVVLSPTTASASTVAGKPPTVLKIKLNTSPTTSETLTITSPPLRDNRHTTFEKSSTTPKSLEPEYPAVTSIKIKPIVAPASCGPVTRKSPSPPTSTRDTRGSAVDSGRKKRKSDEERKHSLAADEKKAKKAKTKKGNSSQAVINNAAFVSEQATDLLGTQNFGWGSAALLWESQLRIPSPLTVPFTVSFARRQANQLKERQKAQKHRSHGGDVRESSRSKQDKFLETNFQLSKQTVIVKQPQNRIWRMRRQVSPPAPLIKLPPPDFVMSSTLEAVLKAIVDDKAGDETDDTSSRNADYSNGACRSQSDSELLLDSMRLGNSPSGDINADVFRMEFPVAAVECASPANLLAFTSSSSAASISATERSQSFSALSTSCLLQATTQTTRRHSASGTEMKFSISNILSNVGAQNTKPTLVEATINVKESNVQETIEVCITNLSRFFWALETCSERTRYRLAEVCLFKRPVLEKILAIVRKLTIVVAPNQIERVLQLESAVEKYFLEPPASATPASVSPLALPEQVTDKEPFTSGQNDDDDDSCVQQREQTNLKELVRGELPKRDEDSLRIELDANDDNSEQVIDAKSGVPLVIRKNLDNSRNQKLQVVEIDSKRVTEVKRELPDALEASKALKEEDSNNIKTPCKPDIKAIECNEVSDNPTANGEHAPKKEIKMDLLESYPNANENDHKINDVTMLEVSSSLIDVIEKVSRLIESERSDSGSNVQETSVLLSEENLEISLSGEDQPLSAFEPEPESDDVVNSTETAMELDECSASSDNLNAEPVKSAVLDEIEMVVDLLPTKVFPEPIENPYGFPGSFGYNMCKSLVPYVPITQVFSSSYRRTSWERQTAVAASRTVGDGGTVESCAHLPHEAVHGTGYTKTLPENRGVQAMAEEPAEKQTRSEAARLGAGLTQGCQHYGGIAREK